MSPKPGDAGTGNLQGEAQKKLDVLSNEILFKAFSVLQCPDGIIEPSDQHFLMQRYVADLLEGRQGVRGKDFNMRWVASVVADLHRILSRGGVFI